MSSRLAQFEKRQKELWRVTFLILVVLATVFAATSWDTLRSLTHRYEALPIGLVVLVGLFGMHVWKRAQEISELRGLVQGIEQRDGMKRKAGGIDHDAGHRAAGLMQPVDQHCLGV